MTELLLLVHTAHPQALEHAGPNFGRLLSPRQYSRVADTAAAGIPWAADNDCFQGLNGDRYRAMLRAIRGLEGCRFVTVPDVVADARATMMLFEVWWEEVAATGQPLAFVAQNDQPPESVPWDRIGALFIGGSTEYKLSAEAADLAREARERGLWAHMGRVNSRKRVAYARQIGCCSVDGSGFSMFRSTWVPKGLLWARDHLQERLPI